MASRVEPQLRARDAPRGPLGELGGIHFVVLGDAVERRAAETTHLALEPVRGLGHAAGAEVIPPARVGPGDSLEALDRIPGAEGRPGLRRAGRGNPKRLGGAGGPTQVPQPGFHQPEEMTEAVHVHERTDPVDQGRDEDRRRDARVGDRDFLGVGASVGEAPDRDPLMVDAGDGAGESDGGAKVLALHPGREEGAGLPLAVAEEAVIESEGGDTRRREPLAVAVEALVADTGEA